MPVLISASSAPFEVSKKLVTVGGDAHLDVRASGLKAGLAFTLMESAPGKYDVIPGSAAKVTLNGQVLSRTTRLKSCDRIEVAAAETYCWLEGTLGGRGGGGASSSEGTFKVLELLQELSGALQSQAEWQSALSRVLDTLVDIAGAESGHLLTDSGAGWVLAASKLAETGAAKRKELFSHTILNEAIRKREPICLESVVGHPMGDAMSVVAAKIFSCMCAPLIVRERVVGAVFLVSHSPGKSIRKEKVTEVRLLATQAALMLAASIETAVAQREAAGRAAESESSELGGWIWGESPEMKDLRKKVEKLAPTPLPVLILGETGSGKEGIARQLHLRGDRAKGPFVAVNCAAIPATLIESTLFGHVRGAFTGAVKDQPGKWAQAQGGTLFLDEIGDLSLDLQAKLLRALQERVVEPIGAGRSIPVDARVVAATHQDLEAQVRSGRFRQDLFFRLNGASVRVPPLRERVVDLGRLSEIFIAQSGTGRRLSAAALEKLQRHPWPGNVRELENVLLRASILAEGMEIQPDEVEFSGGALPTEAPTAKEELTRTLEAAQWDFTRRYVSQVLEAEGGNRAKTAARLSISERTLYRILSEIQA